MYLLLVVDIINNNCKNVSTMYYERTEWVEWTATTFYNFQHSYYFQLKCLFGYVIVDNIQVTILVWLITYAYLLICAQHVFLLGKIIKLKIMYGSFIEEFSQWFWITESLYNFCLFFWQFINIPHKVMEMFLHCAWQLSEGWWKIVIFKATGRKR